MTKNRPALSAWENDRTIVRFPDPAVEVVDERFRSLVVWQEVVERLWTGGRWLEGPVWFGDGRYLLFSDIPNNRMLYWSEVTGDVTVFRQPSNNSNGNTRDRQGRLVTCEHLTRRVTRTEYDGSITVLMNSYEGKPLNAPNDITVHSDGSVWFTDPGWGIEGNYEGDKAIKDGKVWGHISTINNCIDGRTAITQTAVSVSHPLRIVMENGRHHVMNRGIDARRFFRTIRRTNISRNCSPGCRHALAYESMPTS